jgi:hypothetical protein
MGEEVFIAEGGVSLSRRPVVSSDAVRFGSNGCEGVMDPSNGGIHAPCCNSSMMNFIGLGHVWFP